MALYYHLPPLSPTTTTKRKQIKEEKKLRLIFKMKYCKYRPWLRNQGLSQSVPALAPEAKPLLGQNILLFCFVLFQKAETGKQSLRKQTKVLGLIFSPQFKITAVCWLNTYILIPSWVSGTVQCWGCIGELDGVCLHGSPKLRHQGTNLI